MGSTYWCSPMAAPERRYVIGPDPARSQLVLDSSEVSARHAQIGIDVSDESMVPLSLRPGQAPSVRQLGAERSDRARGLERVKVGNDT